MVKVGDMVELYFRHNSCFFKSLFFFREYAYQEDFCFDFHLFRSRVKMENIKILREYDLSKIHCLDYEKVMKTTGYFNEKTMSYIDSAEKTDLFNFFKNYSLKNIPLGEEFYGKPSVIIEDKVDKRAQYGMSRAKMEKGDDYELFFTSGYGIDQGIYRATFRFLKITSTEKPVANFTLYRGTKRLDRIYINQKKQKNAMSWKKVKAKKFYFTKEDTIRIKELCPESRMDFLRAYARKQI